MFDPYTSLETENPSVATIWVGRCLSRLYWHLQQGWLLGSSFDEPIFGTATWKAHARHFKKVDLLFDSLAVVAHSLGVQEPEMLSKYIGKRKIDFSEPVSREDRLVVIDEATEEWLGKRVDGHRESLCRSIIETHVDPTFHEFRKELGRRIPSKNVAQFEFGSCLEEGICRPDVYRFMGGGGGVDLKAAEEMGNLIKEIESAVSPDELVTCDQVRHESDSPPDVLAHVSRDPGDLAPDNAWLRKIPLLWERAGLNADLPDSWNHFVVNNEKRRMRRELLLRLIDEVFTTARDSLLRETTNANIQATLNGNESSVTYRGTKYSVDFECALLFKEYTSSDPPRSFAKFVKRNMDSLATPIRLDRLLRKMPEPLRSLWEHGKGTTLRLKSLDS